MIGEIFSSGGAYLYKDHSDQSVYGSKVSLFLFYPIQMPKASKDMLVFFFIIINKLLYIALKNRDNKIVREPDFIIQNQKY